MKTAQASLALVSGLMAVVAADALPPDDIPLQCITICGPIVELTTDCNVHYRRLKKRNPDALARREWVPKLAVEPPEADAEALLQAARQVGGEPDEAVESFEKRSFSVIVAAPTSFPFALTASTVLDLRPTSTLTRITPVVGELSSTSTLPKQTSTSNRLSTSSTTTTTTISFTTSILNSAASKSMSDDSESPITSSWGWVQEPEGKLYSQGSAEEDCVCLNESFDVAKVAALCASCIAVAGYPENNINVIMEGCNFTALTYTPSKDSAANNIRVEAVWPSSTATTSDVVAVRPARVGVAFAVVGVILATVAMF
ncbi:hypothetical protein AK830_g8266 [Neonectria ditissima]|uniref:Extracellular membrane protein CFEM domain-containing protein n=1 Tax=Neonectria ditissima TaxID=78410 RepID=A0A0P7AUU4_9HYPO|nr:hypothetical protein AK830_g8266 [Neonectria ditissima]